MNASKNQQAVFALLDEYKKAIVELQSVIEDISEVELLRIVDTQTSNPACRSMQTILTHVVSSGYSYCVYIQLHRNIPCTRPQPQPKLTAAEYSKALDAVLEFTNKTFSDIGDDELEAFDNSKKIAAKWGQFYDIEQMMEHAIVHILRHRRQIVNLKRKRSDET